MSRLSLGSGGFLVRGGRLRCLALHCHAMAGWLRETAGRLPLTGPGSRLGRAHLARVAGAAAAQRREITAGGQRPADRPAPFARHDAELRGAVRQ